MKTKTIILFSIIFLFVSITIFADDVVQNQVQDSTSKTQVQTEKIQNSEQYIVYYLHMNRRCMTCEKLEAYSDEAITTAFEKELTDSTIIWKSLNFEEKEYEHFADDYELYSQSVIISKIQDGKEIKWKNLDKIWTLVNDKEAYLAYVQKSITEFMKTVEEEK